jgi:anaerobic ribonucleoside-triphosphate reductase activating protein
MQVDRILFPITSLGPGNRIVIWLIGCQHKCVGCSNPELWAKNKDKEFTVDQLVSLIQKSFKNQDIDGITITGGEPFDQYQDMMDFIGKIRILSSDILVYSGYTLSELKNNIDSNVLENIMQNISVLIDGRYIEALNDSYTPLRGSTNQIIHYIDQSVRVKYELYLEKGRSINNFTYGNNLITVGIINKEKI